MTKNSTCKNLSSVDCASVILRSVVMLLIFISHHAFSQNTKRDDVALVTSWGKLIINMFKTTPKGTPTFNSRFTGYAGLTMYETVVKSNSNYHSLAGKLTGLETLPSQPENVKINYRLALNAGQAQIIRDIFWFTTPENIEAVNNLEKENFAKFAGKSSSKEIEASLEYGKSVAKAIFEWSKSDGGHNQQYNIFDSNYKFTQGNGQWYPPVKGQSEIPLPMHHTWGNNRAFSQENNVLPVPDMIKYDYHKGTEYYNYMFEVYNVGKNLTNEQKEIALWWSDDPSETASPPGHTFSLATIVIEKSKPELVKAAETYAAVGMATADAFINCWKTKFVHNVERPFGFIYYNIDPKWDMFFKEPPFPAYYSGHAGQAGAFAQVLTKLYGENFAFTDDTHANREIYIERMIGFKPRKYKSFYEAAEECAMSRLYAGIHTRLDNEMGLVEGKKIGNNVILMFQ